MIAWRGSRARVWMRLLLGGVLLLAAWWGGRLLLMSRVSAELERAIDHRVTVTSASLGWRSLVATGVTIYGAPPFEGEPLARIARLTVSFGGKPGFAFWAPSEIVGDGVELQYLKAGSIDNWRGRRPPAAAPRSSDGSSFLHRGGRDGRPALVVRTGRMSGLIQPAAGAPRIALRTRGFSLARPADGAQAATIDGLVVDATGIVTVTVPTVAVEWQPQGPRTRLRGREASISIPGGGALARGLRLEGTWTPAAADLTAAPESGAGGPEGAAALRAGVHMDPDGIRCQLASSALPLGPLHGLLQRFGVDPTGATANVEASATLDAGGQDVPFHLVLEAQGLRIQNPALDQVAWTDVPAALRARGTVDLPSSKLTVSAGEVELLGAPLAFHGWTELAASPRGSWQARTPRDSPLPCQELLDHQPLPVRDALRGLKLAGRLGAEVSLAFDASAWENLALDVKVDPTCQVLSEPGPMAELMDTLLRRRAPASSRERERPLGPYHPDFTPLGAMPSHLPAAFVTAEDGGFYRHEGFDVEMIRRALAHDIQVMSFARGASTITQQVAKNLFLTPNRTLARKWEEIVYAWRLGERLDKRRTLEVYLNIIELGPGIRGVKQAARAYFGKSLAELRPIESAHLAALTPNPRGFARRFRDGRVDDGWLHRLYDLLGMMKRSGRISPAELAEARAGKLTLRKI